MLRVKCLLPVTLAMLACVAFPVAMAAREWTIMCLGDSITACSGDFGCYRNYLAEKLADSGYKVRFVGSQQSDSPLGALRYEAYGGRTAEFLAGGIEGWYRANPADIVLLHTGHNHFSEEQPVPGILEATRQIIVTIRRINPAVVILLAKVIPSSKLPKYGYLPELNTALGGLAKQLDTKCSPVILVDQTTGFDPVADVVVDGVHPNDSGAQKIGRRWYDALVPVLSGEAPAAGCAGHFERRP